VVEGKVRAGEDGEPELRRGGGGGGGGGVGCWGVRYGE